MARALEALGKGGRELKKKLTELDIKRIQKGRKAVKSGRVDCHNSITGNNPACFNKGTDPLCQFLFKRIVTKDTKKKIVNTGLECPCFYYTKKGLLSLTTKALRKAGVEPK